MATVCASRKDAPSALRVLLVIALHMEADDDARTPVATREHVTSSSVPPTVEESVARQTAVTSRLLAVPACVQLTAAVVVVPLMVAISRHNLPLNTVSSMEEGRSAARKDVKRLLADERSTVQR